MSYAQYPLDSGSGHSQISVTTNPTLLRADSQFQQTLVDIPVDPLVRQGDHHAIRQVRLEIESEQCLLLIPVPRRPPWFSRSTYILLLGCLCFMIYWGVQGLMLGLEKKSTSAIALWSGFAGLPALILLAALIYPFFKPGPSRYRLDRQTNLLTVQRTVGFSTKQQLMATYSLHDAVALQLLYRYFKAFQAGLHPSSFQKNSFEMNLVFRNVVPPRVNLAVHGDWVWMRQAGHRLAEFLEIPVLDQLCQA